LLAIIFVVERDIGFGDQVVVIAGAVRREQRGINKLSVSAFVDRI
jgi:hypothetical protein